MGQFEDLSQQYLGDLLKANSDDVKAYFRYASANLHLDPINALVAFNRSKERGIVPTEARSMEGWDAISQNGKHVWVRKGQGNLCMVPYANPAGRENRYFGLWDIGQTTAEMIGYKGTQHHITYSAPGDETFTKMLERLSQWTEFQFTYATEDIAHGFHVNVSDRLVKVNTKENERGERMRGLVRCLAAIKLYSPEMVEETNEELRKFVSDPVVAGKMKIIEEMFAQSFRDKTKASVDLSSWIKTPHDLRKELFAISKAFGEIETEMDFGREMAMEVARGELDLRLDPGHAPGYPVEIGGKVHRFGDLAAITTKDNRNVVGVIAGTNWPGAQVVLRCLDKYNQITGDKLVCFPKDSIASIREPNSVEKAQHCVGAEEYIMRKRDESRKNAVIDRNIYWKGFKLLPRDVALPQKGDTCVVYGSMVKQAQRKAHRFDRETFTYEYAKDISFKCTLVDPAPIDPSTLKPHWSLAKVKFWDKKVSGYVEKNVPKFKIHLAEMEGYKKIQMAEYEKRKVREKVLANHWAAVKAGAVPSDPATFCMWKKEDSQIAPGLETFQEKFIKDEKGEGSVIYRKCTVEKVLDDQFVLARVDKGEGKGSYVDQIKVRDLVRPEINREIYAEIMAYREKQAERDEVARRLEQANSVMTSEKVTEEFVKAEKRETGKNRDAQPFPTQTPSLRLAFWDSRQIPVQKVETVLPITTITETEEGVMAETINTRKNFSSVAEMQRYLSEMVVPEHTKSEKAFVHITFADGHATDQMFSFFKGGRDERGQTFPEAMEEQLKAFAGHVIPTGTDTESWKQSFSELVKTGVTATARNILENYDFGMRELSLQRDLVRCMRKDFGLPISDVQAKTLQTIPAEALANTVVSLMDQHGMKLDDLEHIRDVNRAYVQTVGKDNARGAVPPSVKVMLESKTLSAVPEIEALKEDPIRSREMIEFIGATLNRPMSEKELEIYREFDLPALAEEAKIALENGLELGWIEPSAEIVRIAPEYLKGIVDCTVNMHLDKIENERLADEIYEETHRVPDKGSVYEQATEFEEMDAMDLETELKRSTEIDSILASAARKIDALDLATCVGAPDWFDRFEAKQQSAELNLSRSDAERVVLEHEPVVTARGGYER
jgi:hypothetical protein